MEVELDLQNQILWLQMFSKVKFYILEKTGILYFVLINISRLIAQIWYLYQLWPEQVDVQ